MLWTENKTAVEPDGKENKDEIKEKGNEKAGSYQPTWLVRATGAWLMSLCSFPAWWPHQRVGGTAIRHYEHFHTHTARLPPKNMYSRFFTSCVTSKPKPSPITTCHELPNFLSIDSLIIFAALWEDKKRQLHLWLTTAGLPRAEARASYLTCGKRLKRKRPYQDFQKRSVNSFLETLVKGLSIPWLDATLKTGLHTSQTLLKWKNVSLASPKIISEYLPIKINISMMMKRSHGLRLSEIIVNTQISEVGLILDFISMTF